MTDDLSRLADLSLDPYIIELERISKRLPDFPSTFAELRELFALLPPPTPSEERSARPPEDVLGGPTGGALLQPTLLSGALPGTSQQVTLGTTPTYAGNTNVLDDPTFETLPTVYIALTTNWQALGPAWEAKYSLDAGSAPTVPSARISTYAERSGQASPWNSAQIDVLMGWAGGSSGTVTIRLRSKIQTTHDAQAAYRIAAIRARAMYGPTRLEPIAALAEIRKYSDESLLVASPVTSQTWGLASKPWLQPVAIEAAPVYGAYAEYALTIQALAGGDAATAWFVLAEPQLAWTQQPSAPPFAPLIGHWYPDRVYGRSARITEHPSIGEGAYTGWWELIGNVGLTESALQFRRNESLDSPGNAPIFIGYIGGWGEPAIGFGPGGDATQDLELGRRAAKTLQLGVPYSDTVPAYLQHKGWGYNALAAFDMVPAYNPDGTISQLDAKINSTTQWYVTFSYSGGHLTTITKYINGKTLTTTLTWSGDTLTNVGRATA
ncbi:MAG TPA: hypothetical protein VIV06_10830 [Candidatus Limnocylindrales bacterium]